MDMPNDAGELNMDLVDSGLIRTALGEESADLVIRNGKLVNVITEEIYPADVAVKGKRIAYVGDVAHCIGPETTIIDASGSYLTPGLIEPHLHRGTANPAPRLLPPVCQVPGHRFRTLVHAGPSIRIRRPVPSA
jgi:imidazolonepropionase-like amidohydrolase